MCLLGGGSKRPLSGLLPGRLHRQFGLRWNLFLWVLNERSVSVVNVKDQFKEFTLEPTLA